MIPKSDARCSVCKSDNLVLWGTKCGYRLFHCLGCDHRFADLAATTFSRDSERFLHEITNGLMPSDEDYYRYLERGELTGGAVAITGENAVSMIKNLAVSGHWLDVGSGSGHLVARARDNGFDVRGIEPGGWGLIGARKKGIAITQGFLERGMFSERFDVVSATDVLEHQARPLEFLDLLATYVAPGGRLILSIPYVECLEARLLGVNWNMVGPPTHSQFFSRSSLDLALRKVGFEIEALQQYHVHHRLRWILKYKLLRQALDAAIPGSQLLCVAARSTPAP